MMHFFRSFFRSFYRIVLLLVLLIGLSLYFFIYTTAGVHALIKLAGFALPGKIQLTQVNGRLLDKLTIGGLHYQESQMQISASNITLDWNLRSILQQQIPINNLAVSSLRIERDNTIEQISKIELRGLLKRDGISIDSLKARYLQHQLFAKIRVNPQLPYTTDGYIKLSPFKKAAQPINGRLNIAGDINDLHWAGEVNGPAKLTVSGSLKQGAVLNQIIKWHDAHWAAAPDRLITSPEGRLKITGTLPKLKAELTTKIAPFAEEQWQLNANVQGQMPLQWTFDITAALPYVADSKKQGIYTRINLKGALQDQQHGHLALSLAPGHIQLPKEQGIAPIAFKGGVIKAILTPKQLMAKGTLAIDAQKQLKLSLNLPKFDLNKGITAKQSVSADLALMINSFDFLGTLTPEVKQPKGSMQLALNVRGTASKPQIVSTLKLNNSSLNLPTLGLNLNTINLTFTGKENQWQAKGSINSGTSKLTLKGQGALAPELNGELLIQGNNVVVMNTDEYQVHISPKVTLNYTQSILNINGTILVPYAQIKPTNFSSSLSASEDIVFKSQQGKAAPNSPLNTKMDIQIDMGKQVEVNTKGLHALLEGTVHLKQIPQGPINATGELNVTKGDYKAYNQNLDIEQGELFFTGGAIDNPGINVRAIKKINASASSITGTNQLLDFNSSNLQNANLSGSITVGVEVTGRLAEPKIQLFSNPAILSQADILSMLVLGRPASQANKAGGQLLMTAISSMNLTGKSSGGTQLLSQLKKSTGLDFDVQTNSNYNLATNQMNDSTGFVVGKSLSERMYLSYTMGLSQSDPNVLTLKYLLNKFFSIQVSSSTTSNGIDFLYTSTKK